MNYAEINGQDIDTDHFHKRIHCRSGHITAQYNGYLLVWGGFMEHPSGNHSEYHPTNELILYNSFTEVWSRKFTTGDTPQRNSGSCGVVLDDKLYIFGGFQDNRQTWTDDVNINDLYCLNLRTLDWKKLHPRGIVPLACDKLVGWTYNNKLYFFGGYGPSPETLDVPFQHFPSHDDVRVRGWNNQLLCYDPDFNEWSWPNTRGPTPCPRAAHAADISGNTVYIFGGRLRDERMRNLHSLNMDTMRWSGNLMSPEEQGPEGRSWHSLTFINKDVAILYGGFSQQSMILNDCWILKLPQHTWEPVTLQPRQPRLWHQTVYFSSARILAIVGGHKTSVFDSKRLMAWVDDCWKLHTGGEMVNWEEVHLAYDHGHPRFWHTSQCCSPGEVIIHGGQVQPYYQLHFLLQEHADSLLKLNFEPKSLLRLCLNTAIEHFKETRPEWSTLPSPLRDILDSRLKQLF